MKHIEVISGEIEATGQTVFDQTGTKYAYLRILDDSGQVRMVKNACVPNTVNSYISPGAKGLFFIAKINTRINIPFAFIDSSGRKVYDSQDMRHIRKVLKTLGFKMMLSIPFCLLLIFLFGIGLILTPIALYLTYTFWIKVPKMLEDSRLKEYLTQHGFNFA